MILLLISFVAGALTALAPCTIALLPVIVGGSLTGERSVRRAAVVTISLGASVMLFTFLLKASTAFINVPESFWQYLSGGIIAALGIAMVYPTLWEKIPGLSAINIGSNRVLTSGYKQQTMAGDILVGAALGPVFSSCSPTYFLILATVLPSSLVAAVVYLSAYTIGMCGLLFIIAIAGQKLLERLGAASDPRGRLKRAIGIIFVVLGALIFFGYEQKLELAAANTGFLNISRLEQSLLMLRAGESTDSSYLNASTTDALGTTAAARAMMKDTKYPKAPEITNPSGFINTRATGTGQANGPITIGEFKGKKVVMIDFWTYSCINCQRTLPYVKAWYDKYHDQGLEIISIHTPEFAFEHVLNNVQKAVDGFGIKYPVVLDNDYGTWNAFGNQYWPRKYLIDIDGYVVYDHAGEGDYDVTERAIQKALQERAAILGEGAVASGVVDPKDAVTGVQAGSPETYFGAARNAYLGNGRPGTQGRQTFMLPQDFSLNTLYLNGAWEFYPEFARSLGVSSVVYRYRAKDVYFVASAKEGVKSTILIDGRPVGALAGSDVAADGTVMIKDNRLYHLIHSAEAQEHVLEIRTPSGGLDAYTFTFG